MQVVQLVAQKLTKVTLPLRSAVFMVDALISTKLEFGARLALPTRELSQAVSKPSIVSERTTPRAAATHFVFFIESFQMNTINRRNFNQRGVQALTALLMMRIAQNAEAFSLSDLTTGDAASALRTALSRGTEAAVASLGKTDGFLGNSLVRIALPGYLEDASKLLRNFGQGARIDELVTTLNRAAEQAVPMAKNLLVSTVRAISVSDAKNILSGGEGAVTQFFAEKTRAPLGTQFLPIVTKATERVGLAEKYNSLAGKLQQFGLVKPEDANIQKYVTGKSLDGLYLMIGEEEKKIRQDPIGTGSAILSKVFGALK